MTPDQANIVLALERLATTYTKSTQRPQTSHEHAIYDTGARDALREAIREVRQGRGDEDSQASNINS